MSEASRAHALAHAAMVHQGSGDAAATLETAEAFHAFVTSDSTPAAAPAKAPVKSTPTKAPAGKAPAKKAPVVEDAAEEETAEEGEVTKEQVGEAVEALLNANMRDSVVALFKKYKAKSLSSIKPEDYVAIKQEADDLLLSS